MLDTLSLFFLDELALIFPLLLAQFLTSILSILGSHLVSGLFLLRFGRSLLDCFFAALLLVLLLSLHKFFEDHLSLKFEHAFLELLNILRLDQCSQLLAGTLSLNDDTERLTTGIANLSSTLGDALFCQFLDIVVLFDIIYYQGKSKLVIY